MSKFRVLSSGEVLVATQTFMDAVHPEDYELVAETAKTHEVMVTSAQLLTLFDGAEIDAMLDSANADVQKLMFRLTNRNVTIDTSGALYQGSIALLFSEGILTAARRDELLLGFPVGFTRVT